jgi:phage host-nuclease inhibitor protein Gam
MVSFISSRIGNKMSTKIELVVQALQERIGQMSANYETQVAVLRAEITMLSDELKKYTSVQEETASTDNN